MSAREDLMGHSGLVALVVRKVNGKEELDLGIIDGQFMAQQSRGFWPFAHYVRCDPMTKSLSFMSFSDKDAPSIDDNCIVLVGKAAMGYFSERNMNDEYTNGIIALTRDME